jgi:choline kinase
MTWIMHCVILAAGTSSRLHPLTADIPMCLLPVGGQPILERALRAIFAAGVPRCTIVAGSHCAMIRSYIRRDFPHEDIHLVFNERYEVTNSGYSLLCAAPAVANEDILMLDGNVVFDTGIIELLLQAPHHDCVAICTHGRVGGDDVKVRLNDRDEVVRIGRDLMHPPIAGTTVGIQKLTAATALRLFDTLERSIHTHHLLQTTYETALQEMIDGGTILHAVDTGDLHCAEIGNLADLPIAEARFMAPQPT